MTKQIPANIHKAPEFEKVEESTQIIQETKPKFKTSNISAQVNFREPVKTDRPKNIYIELIDGQYWLWYNTEQSQEIGIERQYTVDEKTQIKSEYGYKCNIPATKENIDLLKPETFAGTQYLFKDNTRRTLIKDIGEFLNQIKQ